MRKLALSIAVVAMFGPVAAHAFDGVWSAQAGMAYEQLEEVSATGATLVEETGWQPYLELGNLTRLPAGAVRTRLLVSGGALDYAGRTQAGGPFDSSTDYRRARLSVAYAYPVSTALEIGGGIEAEWLERDVQGRGLVSGIEEEYRFQRLFVRLGYAFQAFGRGARLELDGIGGIGGSQEVYSPGVIDRIRLDHGDTYGVRAALAFPLGRPVAEGLSWTLAPHIEYFHSDRGDNRPWLRNGLYQGVVAQPETRRWQVGIGLRANW